jgi:hypothetical protein
MPVAGRYDFAIITGTTFGRSLLWKNSSGNPVDLSGFSARLQVRGDADPAPLYADLSSETGGIVLGGTDGTIALSISSADTAAFPAGLAKYDLFVTNLASFTSCLLFGTVTIRAGVTQA